MSRDTLGPIAMQTPQREPSSAEVPNAPKKPKRPNALRSSPHKLVTARNLMRAFLEAQDVESDATSCERT
jgi:hypothetical protein